MRVACEFCEAAEPAYPRTCCGKGHSVDCLLRFNRDERRPLGVVTGHTWTDAEEEWLKKLFRAGVDVRTLALAHDRPVYAILRRLQALGEVAFVRGEFRRIGEVVFTKSEVPGPNPGKAILK